MRPVWHSLVSVFHVEVVSSELLLLILDRIHLVNAGAVVSGVTTEGDVELVEEGVHTRDQRLEYNNIEGCKKGLVSVNKYTVI